MNTVLERLGNLKKIWKELSLVGMWVMSISGAFLLPLPGWASVTENESLTQFSLFVATVLAGFVIIYTLKNKSKIFWLYTSISVFILFVGIYFTYTHLRSSLTLPYNNSDRLIGSVTVLGYDLMKQNFEKEFGGPLEERRLLQYVGGDASLLWTQESINTNKYKLVGIYIFTFSVLTIFLISFLNLILLYGSPGKT